MPRWFNTAGPCQADIHYALLPTVRLPGLERLIAQRNYFVIHAPRQVGKTTAMLALAQQLTESGQYTAVMLSVEVGAPFSQDIAGAEEAILGAWRDNISVRLPPELQPPDWPAMQSGQKIRAALQVWSQASSRPLVILIDEIDALQDQALISILRQLRDGYPNRPKAFPQSVGLIGLRDVRDYKVAGGEVTDSIPPARLILKCDRLRFEILMLRKLPNSTPNILKIPDKFLHQELSH
ncbi:MAG: ATP-binding protein [Thermosynechococcaceae cyanobacterium]